jgi:hypothetical protein
MPDYIVDPKTASSQELKVNPTMRAFGSNKVYWEWLEEPGNEKRLRRFGSAMIGSIMSFPHELCVDSSCFTFFYAAEYRNIDIRLRLEVFEKGRSGGGCWGRHWINYHPSRKDLPGFTIYRPGSAPLSLKVLRFVLKIP